MMMAERISKIPLSMVMLMLATVLAGALFLAISSYFGFSANVESNNHEKARFLLAAAGDPMQSNARFDFNDGFANRASIADWKSRINRNLKSISLETAVYFYSPMSEYSSVSTAPNEFLKTAYEKLANGDVDFVETQLLHGSKNYTHYVVRQYSKGECLDCSDNQLIGVREIVFSSQVSNVENTAWLFNASVALLGSLIFLLVIVVPVSRSKDRERVQTLRQVRRLELAANTDVLTGLPNRRFFETAIEKHLLEFNEMDKNFGLFILDIDHFKQVNDKFGHDAGDVVLQKIAGRISRATLKNEIACRIGGEEFAIIAPYERHESVASVAERFREVVAEMYIDVGSTVIRPSVSIGVATNVGRGNHSEDLLKTADEKLYVAKHNGRNQVAA